MIQVKVCGITTPEDARAAIEAGADALGLNFVPGTLRALDDAAARSISAAVAGRVVRVGVFQDAPLERVRHCVEEIGLDVVQLHGDESPEYVAEIPFPVLKVLPASAGLEQQAQRYPKVDLLIDHPAGGGSGETWNYDWALALIASGRRAARTQRRYALSCRVRAPPLGLVPGLIAGATSTASADAMYPRCSPRLSRS